MNCILSLEPGSSLQTNTDAAVSLIPPGTPVTTCVATPKWLTTAWTFCPSGYLCLCESDCRQDIDKQLDIQEIYDLYFFLHHSLDESRSNQMC